MNEGSLTEIKGGIADARSDGTNPLTSNQLRDLQSGRVVQMAEGSGQILPPLTGTQLRDLQHGNVVQMNEGSLTEIKGGIADARSGGTNPLTSNQLRDLQSGRVVQMAEGSGQILPPLTGTQLMDERSMAEANRAFAEQRDRMAALMG